MQKRGQLTLFIILGIVIVTGVLTYVFVFSEYAIFNPFGKEISDPEAYMEDCLIGEIEETINSFVENNFYSSEVEENYFRYNNDGVSEKIPYLCKVGDFYRPCINQEPNLQGKMREEIIQEIQPRVDICWGKLVSNFQRRGYTVQEDMGGIELISLEEGIRIRNPSSMVASSGGESESYSNFEMLVNTKLFKLATLATQIVNMESTLCEFDQTTWMLNFPDILIERFRGGDQTKVYTLRDRLTGEEIKFAIRTCILPAGI
jgi:hypothetical protein